MAIAFTTSFNSTYKTLTLSVTDFDGEANVNIWYKKDTDGELSDVAVDTIPDTQATTPIYYDSSASPSILTSGTEEDIFLDGLHYIYVVPTTVAREDVEDNYSAYVAISTAQIKCCILSKVAALDSYECEDCTKDHEVLRLSLLRLLLEGAEFDALATCADYTEAETKLEYITEMCDADTDCIKRNCD